MNKRARLLPSLITIGLCTQCVTVKTGTSLNDEKNVIMGCKYVSVSRNLEQSEVECMIQNNGATPAQISFEKVSLDDPASTISPVDVTKISNGQALESIAVILGVVVVLGVLVALASKSNNIPNIHVGIPDPPPARKTIRTSIDSRRVAFADKIEIPAYRSAILVFKAEHGVIKPKTLALQLDGVQERLIKVPIKDPFRRSTDL